MKFAWSSTRAFIAGLALIAATNAVALIGVAYNRSGEPESRLQLTERELQLNRWSRFDTDNSGVDLHVYWRIPRREAASYGSGAGFYSGGVSEWLDKAKLSALGFDVSRPVDTPEGRLYYDKLLPKEVLLVLEYDGPAYQAALEQVSRRMQYEAELVTANPGKEEFKRRADATRVMLDREERVESRLFVVDAGLDARELRARYPNRERYAIMRGQVQPGVFGTGRNRYPAGYVTKLSVDTINVPLAYHATLDPLFEANRRSVGRNDPRYHATVAFGKRFEPWIIAISPRLSP